MLVYAAGEFSGVRQHKHGGSEREHIEALRAMGANIEESKSKIPSQLIYLYDIFKTLRFSKVPNDDDFLLMARESLTYSDIELYSKNSGLEFEMWEIDTLMNLSATFDRVST